jgi:hypothetical protein
MRKVEIYYSSFLNPSKNIIIVAYYYSNYEQNFILMCEVGMVYKNEKILKFIFQYSTMLIVINGTF